MTNPQRLQAICEKMAILQKMIGRASEMVDIHGSDIKSEKYPASHNRHSWKRIYINGAIIARLQNYYDNLKTEL